MIGARIQTGRARTPTFLLLAALHACGPLPTVVEEHSTPALSLSLDTLDIQIQALWVRVSAVPANPEDLMLTWELDARTANPFWRPAIVRKHGGRSFEMPDTARIWGNVARAYDFTLAVAGVTASGAIVADTLVVEAPRCSNPQRPTLLCNPLPAGRASVTTTRRNDLDRDG